MFRAKNLAQNSSSRHTRKQRSMELGLRRENANKFDKTYWRKMIVGDKEVEGFRFERVLKEFKIGVQAIVLLYCNLFDNFFPNDWSSLVSLLNLSISGNKVTSLPEYSQPVSRIQRLIVGNCSRIQSIIGLMKNYITLISPINVCYGLIPYNTLI
ncbi:hypothetical protein LXL04_001316 [Taraxacum kok-saghyz]